LIERVTPERGRALHSLDPWSTRAHESRIGARHTCGALDASRNPHLRSGLREQRSMYRDGVGQGSTGAAACLTRHTA